MDAVAPARPPAWSRTRRSPEAGSIPARWSRVGTNTFGSSPMETVDRCPSTWQPGKTGTRERAVVDNPSKATTRAPRMMVVNRSGFEARRSLSTAVQAVGLRLRRPPARHGGGDGRINHIEASRPRSGGGTLGGSDAEAIHGGGSTGRGS